MPAENYRHGYDYNNHMMADFHSAELARERMENMRQHYHNLFLQMSNNNNRPSPRYGGPRNHF
jgi:hypothetical protein